MLFHIALYTSAQFVCVGHYMSLNLINYSQHLREIIYKDWQLENNELLWVHSNTEMSHPLSVLSGVILLL